MSKLRVVFIVALVASFLLGVEALAAGRDGGFATDSGSILASSTTLSQTAVFAAFLANLDSGADGDSAISVSNILGAPSGSGFPEGGDTMGSLSIYLYDTNSDSAWVFDTADNPTVGSGLDASGQLGSGKTYTVLLSEVVNAVGGGDFVGYAWIVANFDAVAGTFVNFFPALGVGQSFQMQPTTGGTPVSVP